MHHNKSWYGGVHAGSGLAVRNHIPKQGNGYSWFQITFRWVHLLLANTKSCSREAITTTQLSFRCSVTVAWTWQVLDISLQTRLMCRDSSIDQRNNRMINDRRRKSGYTPKYQRNYAFNRVNKQTPRIMNCPLTVFVGYSPNRRPIASSAFLNCATKAVLDPRRSAFWLISQSIKDDYGNILPKEENALILWPRTLSIVRRK